MDKKARLGKDVSVGPFTVIEDDVEIGDGSSVGSHALIAAGARIGKNCQIHTGTVVATLPQDLKFGGEKTTFELGDNCVVREFCTLNRGTTQHGKSETGPNCLFMAYVHVAHDCIIGKNVILANGVQLGGHVKIEDWVIVGGMTPIHQFCRVGQHAMVGGAYRAVQDVPPYTLVSGEPLRYHGLNSIGLRRRGFKVNTLTRLKAAYRLIYRSKLNLTQALERIKAEVEMIPEVKYVIEFIESSERGII